MASPTPPATSPPPAAPPAPPAPPAPEPIPSGEATPWTGDPGFPRAENWLNSDPRWLRKWIPKKTHVVFFILWSLFVIYILWLKVFHTDPSTYKAPPPPAENVEYSLPTSPPHGPSLEPHDGSKLAPAAPPAPGPVPAGPAGPATP